MIGPRPDCMDCKHFDHNNVNGLTCKAFPEGISDDILMGKKHLEPVKGQVGAFVFEKEQNE